MSITPISGISYLIDGLLPLVAWLVVRRRKKQTPNNHQLDIWGGFFLNLSIFLIIMALPHAVLYSRPDMFAGLMTLAYVIGHVFLYLALASLVRLDAILIERLYGREQLLKRLWMAIGLVITLVNIAAPNHPFIDHQGITNLGASAPMGALIPIFTLATSVPLAVLFFRTALRQNQTPGIRQRSALLGLGLLLVMAGGPVHDFAKTAGVLFVADAITAIAQLVLLMGVLFRPKTQTSPTQTPQVGE